MHRVVGRATDDVREATESAPWVFFIAAVLAQGEDLRATARRAHGVMWKGARWLASTAAQQVDVEERVLVDAFTTFAVNGCTQSEFYDAVGRYQRLCRTLQESLDTVLASFGHAAG